MAKDSKILVKLFKATFTLSAFTFGGGYVIVPLMRKRFVEDNRWIGEDEMLDIVAIAQSAPGVIAVNTGLLAGYRIAGVAGAFVATLATVLPPLIIISAIAMFYAAFIGNAAVSAVMKAMQAGVAAVIIDAVIKMGRSTVKGKDFKDAAIMAGCFALSYFLSINVVAIILSCAVLGAVNALIRAKKAGGRNDIP
ncbi:MAG: chromate transporter [Oscillospiraceae bacterium]|nr:chromate transporter [Oscillospiraceae bacterium]